MWGFSLQFWQSVWWVATILTAIFGSLGIVAALISAWVGWGISDVVQQDADTRIAEAGVVAATANAEAAKANVARAQERTALLEKESAEAKLEHERLKQKLAWRRLTAEQHAILVNALKGKLTSVWVSFVKNDDESLTFREDFAQTMRDAGVEPKYFGGWTRAVGLSLTDLPGPEFDAVAVALTAAGLDFHTTNEGVMGSKELELIVGSKPPPF